jgi:division protein 1
MDKHRRDESPSGLSDIVEPDGLLGTGLTVSSYFFFYAVL